MKKLFAYAFLFLSLAFLLPGCGKDIEDPVSVDEPTITPTFIIGTDTKSATVPVTVSWTTKNTIKGTLDGESIQIPSGDTTFLMEKGETKNFTFVVENTNGKKVQEYLKVSVPTDPSVPTLSVSFTYEGETIDTLGVPPVEGWPIVAKVIFTGGTLNFNGCDYANSPKEFNLTIAETKTYDFKVTGPGGDITESVTIVVAQPVPFNPTQGELLISSYPNYFPWIMVKLEFQNGPDLPWYEDDIDDCLKDNLLYFYLTPLKKMVNDRGEISCNEDEQRVSEGPWSLVGNILTDQSLIIEIISLNQDTLVYKYNPGGMLRGTKITFVHPQVTK